MGVYRYIPKGKEMTFIINNQKIKAFEFHFVNKDETYPDFNAQTFWSKNSFSNYIFIRYDDNPSYGEIYKTSLNPNDGIWYDFMEIKEIFYVKQEKNMPTFKTGWKNTSPENMPTTICPPQYAHHNMPTTIY